MTDLAETYRNLVALQGVSLDEKRAASAAEVLQRQHVVEQAATRELAFEVEPAGFAGTLHAGTK
ncbi:MAG: hypothetical protein O3A06_03320 [Proteobacteria bacterium]|nr:hypothetical protein [Pseudomonadota bacterium]MDA0982070.1 hypothetical protein [Pseudomonadota bacterium]